MRKGIPTILVAVLAACGGAAATNNVLGGSAEAGQGSARGGASGDAWTGHYEGRLDGGDGVVDIGPARGAGERDVYVFIGELNRCTGEMRGTGRASGNRLIVTAPVPEQEQCAITMTRNGARLSLGPSPSCAYFHGHSCALVGTVTRTSPRPQNLDGDAGRPSARSGGQRGQPENPAATYAELVGATEGGGMPGCFDPSLRGRERAVAERLGGSPCGGASSPAPSGGNAWLVGAWAVDRSECRTIASFTFNRDGTFYTDGNAGTWRLSGSALTLIETEYEGEEGWQRGAPTRYSYQVTRTRSGMQMRGPEGTTDLTRC